MSNLVSFFVGSPTNSSYPVGTLYRTQVMDENGNKTLQFTDKDGKVLLKKVQATDSTYLSTHYIYDELGNLRYVLPPAVAAVSFVDNSTSFNNYSYAYRYDQKNRLIEKKIPGKGWEYMVYNKLDQLVASQDSLQRAKANPEWSFVKYDSFGRQVMTGYYSTGEFDPATIKTRAQLQTLVNNYTGPQWEIRNNSMYLGYTSNSYVGDDDNNFLLQTANYYDDYAFTGNVFGNPISGESSSVKGLLTATVLSTATAGDGGTQYLSVNYYDGKARLVRVKSQNHLGGTDVVSNTYNFTGELTASTRTHIASAHTTTIATNYSYDHMGRKRDISQSINGAAPIVLSRSSYTEIGQLQKKSLHSINSGVSFLDSTQYTYNERGWLKNLNSPLFSETLKYNDGAVPQYNGNISNQVYSNGGSSGTFTYSYDRLNRLTLGEVSSSVMSEALSYDVMGNIQTLSRDGATAGAYHYTGNRLDNITGGPLATGTYLYDGNGNATYDGRNNKSISYNVLDLPETVSGNITYTYDASGRKLSKNSNGTVRNYVDGIEYNGTTIDIIHTDEGIARNNAGVYSYEYNLSDHLGNVRVSFTKNPSSHLLDILQRDDYYAFGKRNVVSGGTNKYLYNGKEIQDELGGQYDYGARFYDPVIGRWNVVDPLAEKFHQYSPYAYVLNNPLVFIDLDGRDILVAFTGGPDGGGKTKSPQNAGTAGRIVQDAAKYAKENNIEFSGRVIAPGVTSGSAVTNALDFIQKNYTEGEKVLLYGYSYGGDFAVELAAELKELGIDVDLVVTVDASEGPLQNSTVDNVIPDNVKENLNYFQTDDSGGSSGSHKSSDKAPNSGSSDSPGSNGGPNKAKDSSKTKVTNIQKTGKGITHGNIDENTRKEVTKKITNTLGN